MGRIEKAMQRAGDGTEAPDPRTSESTGASDSAAFVVSEAAGDAPEPAAAPSTSAGALVLRDAPMPVWSESRRPVSGEDVQLVDVLQTLSRRRWLITAVVAAFIAVALGYNAVATRLYEAQARLMIEPSAPQVVTFRPVVTEDQWTQEYFATQVQVLRSRALVQETLARLGTVEPGVPADESQLNAFLASLAVTPVPESRLVDLSVRSEDRTFAARAANVHAQAYVDQNLESLSRPSRDASQWLTERLAELRQQVDSAQGALQQYREKQDAISLEDRQNVVLQKLTQLNATVTTARTERIAKQTLYDQLRSLQQSGAPLDTFPPILSNTFIQQLKAELAGLQRQRAQLAEQLGDLHPDMVKVDTAMHEAERRLDAEIQKVVHGIQNDFAAAETNERALLNALERQEQEVLSLNRASIGYGALQRDAASAQQIFESVLQRYKEADLTAELRSNNIRIVDAAVVPVAPVWPRTSLNLAVALFGGLFVAIALALGLEHLNRRVDSPDEIGDTLGVPVLGATPQVAGASRRQLEGPESSVPAVFREALRGIRARILLSPSAASVHTFVVTSAGPNEGKTVVASNLAASLARAGRRVLLIDGDLRRPRLHRLHSMTREPGLSDVLTGSVRIGEALRTSRLGGLVVLTAGTPVSNPGDVLETHRLKDLFAQLSDEFDLILIDSPPVMAVADASIIANAASAALFVVAAGAATRETIQAAIERLSAVQAQVIGVVMNKVNPVREAHYTYPYDSGDDYVNDYAESFTRTTGPGTYA